MKYSLETSKLMIKFSRDLITALSKLKIDCSLFRNEKEKRNIV